MSEVKRGPGRPRQDSLKKGNSSWKPASVTEVIGLDPDFRHRWVNKDPDNLAKKQAEGWVSVDKTKDQATPTEHNRLNEGESLTSAYEKRDVVLMKIPEELAQERDAYFNNETARRTSGLTAHIKKEVGKEGGETHGDITISSRQGTQTI